MATLCEQGLQGYSSCSSNMQLHQHSAWPCPLPALVAISAYLMAGHMWMHYMPSDADVWICIIFGAIHTCIYCDKYINELWCQRPQISWQLSSYHVADLGLDKHTAHRVSDLMASATSATAHHHQLLLMTNAGLLSCLYLCPLCRYD